MNGPSRRLRIRFSPLLWVLVLALAVVLTSCAAPRPRPAPDPNANRGGQVQNDNERSGSGDTGSSVGADFGMAGMVPMIQVVRAGNPKLSVYEQLTGDPANNGDQAGNREDARNGTAAGAAAGLRYFGPDGPGIRLLVNRGNQVVGIQVAQSSQEEVPARTPDGTVNREERGPGDQRQTGEVRNMGVDSNRVIYLVDPDTVDGTADQNQRDIGTDGRDRGTNGDNNADRVNDGRNGMDINNGIGVANTVTLDNLRRWNPTLDDMVKKADFIPGIGIPYAAGDENNLILLVDKEERLTGVKALFPARVEWQPWFDQLPGEVLTRDPNQRNQEQQGNTQASTMDRFFTQHIMFADPAKIR